jgi:hypothetical protein
LETENPSGNPAVSTSFEFSFTWILSRCRVHPGEMNPYFFIHSPFGGNLSGNKSGKSSKTGSGINSVPMEDCTNACCGESEYLAEAQRDSRKRKPNVNIKRTAENKTTAQRRNSLILSCIVPMTVSEADDFDSPHPGEADYGLLCPFGKHKMNRHFPYVKGPLNGIANTESN